MAKTFIRPDTARPYASVGVLLLDKRRIRLHLMGGTQDPGGDRGVKGPGAIPEAEKKNLCLPGLALAKQLYEAVRAQGYGRKGTQALMLALEHISNVKR